jgi:ABC-type glycerol-3-phosphate transport system permease component
MGRRGRLFAVAVVGICAAVIFPIYWAGVTSFQYREQLYVFPPPFVPGKLSLGNYRDVFQGSGLAGWLWNSFLVSAAATAFSVVLSALGAYSLSRFRYRGRGAMGYLILVTQMLPPTLLVIPIYLIFRDLRLVDTLTGLVLAYTTFALPLCVWMLKGFFDTIPRELEEAAQVDGCSRMGAFVRVVLPLSTPGIAATSFYAFIVAWDEYLLSRTLISTESRWVSSVGLSSFIGAYTTSWDQMMAASLVVALPPLVIFFFLQRYLVSGLTSGALKG